MSGKLSEKLLLYQAQTKRDPEAYAKLYDEYVKRIYRFVYFKVSNHEEAEDITSEVFLKAWDYLQEKKEIKSFAGFLYRIARNLIVDHYRAKTYKSETVITVTGEEATEAGDRGAWSEKIEIKIEAQGILQAIKKLKQEYQEVVTLRYVDELGIDEIAEITGKGKIAVRVTLHRALKKLEEIMEK
jgi:RNA polymerase sigma-70 factor (ECF subfamily)